MPRAKAQAIRDFVAAYGAATFEHASEILPLLQRNAPAECHVSRHKLELDDRLRAVYRARVKHFFGWWTRRRASATLVRDTRVVAAQLDSTKDQRTWAWNLTLPERTHFEWYELRDDGRIIGAVMYPG